MHRADFNPRTPCGVRLRVTPQGVAVRPDFNPRTPCGVRRDGRTVGRIKNGQISIHAPLAGCDVYGEALKKAIRIFQSTHPLRGATLPSKYWFCWQIFQSTHPLRGATYNSGSRPALRGNFNPRTPCGVRHSNRAFPAARPAFQSTHPLRGATASQKTIQRLTAHFNPRTPCGVRLHHPQPQPNRRYFNPRTPCGVRLVDESTETMERTQFQSTHPLRGATHRPCRSSVKSRFQSTHPLRGATIQIGLGVGRQHDFNPRTPCGVRLFRAA